MRVEGTHEPVVPYELFVKANSILKQCEFKQSGRRERNIYCCGYCGRMMNSNKGAVVCGQRYYRQECDCRMAKIKKADADKAVKQQVRMAVREEALPAGVKSRAVPYPWQEEMKTLEKTAAAMKKAWMLLYEQYTDGNLSREDFLLEKKRHEEEPGRLESRMDELKREQEAQWEGDRQERERASQLTGFLC